MSLLQVIGVSTVLVGGLGLLHSYILYPLFWVVVEKLGWLEMPSFDRAAGAGATPRVSVIVAAYNEERHIGDRIQNLLQADYPMDHLEILIASDGSSDKTVSIAEEQSRDAANVRILDFTDRRGKTSVLNDACREATGSVLVFSDANVEFAPSAIRELVTALANEKVGCACGRLVFRSPTGAVHEQSESLYWRLETWLKTREGKAGALLGANGAIYAMKADLWEPCPTDTLVDDFFIPMRLLMKGSKVVYAPAAVAEEDLPAKPEDEFGRRVRIGAGNFQALFRFWPLLAPWRGLPAWVFFSHKVLRWTGPLLMIMLLAGSLMLAFEGIMLAVALLISQAIFYGAAVLGLTGVKLPGPLQKVCGVASHFVAMNAALFVGFLRWLAGSQRVTWNRTRR